MVNADVVKGPYGKNVTNLPNVFFDRIKAFPDKTLSLMGRFQLAVIVVTCIYCNSMVFSC